MTNFFAFAKNFVMDYSLEELKARENNSLIKVITGVNDNIRM